MPDISVDRAVKDEAQNLVDAVSRRWPKQAMAPVEEDMRYGQYAEAVLNIIAISYKDELPIQKQELQSISVLIDMMDLRQEVLELVTFLKKQHIYRSVDEDENIMAFLP